MMETIDANTHEKLREIGLEEYEISTLQILRELKSKNRGVDIKKLINKAAFQSLSKSVSETFDQNQWSDEDFYNIVEDVRSKRKKR